MLAGFIVISSKDICLPCFRNQDSKYSMIDGFGIIFLKTCIVYYSCPTAAREDHVGGPQDNFLESVLLTFLGQQ
jgi:hypothetical protein